MVLGSPPSLGYLTMFPLPAKISLLLSRVLSINTELLVTIKVCMLRIIVPLVVGYRYHSWVGLMVTSPLETHMVPCGTIKVSPQGMSFQDRSNSDVLSCVPVPKCMMTPATRTYLLSLGDN